MLQSLHISNYALISDLEINFGSGFSVITGETGAGKSIIIGALSLILGQRAEIRSIKEGEQKCVIEADFNIKGYELQDFFGKNDLDYDESHCVIRRELTAAGKSRAFVNDTPVSLVLLRDLSSRLIDIHSQHENLLLSNDIYQLEVVDTIAGNREIFNLYKEQYADWRKLQAELVQLKKNAEKRLDDQDYIRFQYDQLVEARLVEREQEELEQEQETLSHAEEIKSGLSHAGQLLSGEQAVLSMLKESQTFISHIKDYIALGAAWTERLKSVYIEIKDIADEVSAFEERVEYNPERLEWVENRLSDLYGLFKKYKVNSVDALIAVRDKLGEQLQQIESFDEDIERLQKKIAAMASLLDKTAEQLTNTRKQACKPIEDYLVVQLSQLGMPNIRFEVALNSLDEYGENGKDEVQFLFSANKNRALQPVVSIASGGEIARVMLAIKSLIAHKAGLPTIVFDEIDTGVSGEIADKMGQIMSEMGKVMQVVTITHLPQIAAQGTSHYKVFKDETGTQARTDIRFLDDTERIKEIAQMLSGKEVTEAAVMQARQLLGK